MRATVAVISDRQAGSGGARSKFSRDDPAAARLIACDVRLQAGGYSAIPRQQIRERLLPYAARILIPHQTTAIAMTIHVAARAFSKADEGMVLLSFAYPGETLSDSNGYLQPGKG